MKKYNIQNYIRYKEDVKKSILNIEGKFWDEYTRDELIIKFLPLVENLGRKFSIRRRIDMARGDMRIPEHKLNEIRNNPKDEKMVALFFNSIFTSTDNTFNNDNNEDGKLTSWAEAIRDESEPYNIELLNSYLKSLMLKHLIGNEYEVLRLSYGLDCDKHSAKEIASTLNINGASSYVRVSELKRQAIQRLIDNVDHSQVIDYL